MSLIPAARSAAKNVCARASRMPRNLFNLAAGLGLAGSLSACAIGNNDNGRLSLYCATPPYTVGIMDLSSGSKWIFTFSDERAKYANIFGIVYGSGGLVNFSTSYYENSYTLVGPNSVLGIRNPTQVDVENGFTSLPSSASLANSAVRPLHYAQGFIEHGAIVGGVPRCGYSGFSGYSPY